MCPALFPTQINSISLISNGPFWDLQAVFKQHDGLRPPTPPCSRVPSVTNVTTVRSARPLIPITWHGLAGSFSSHALFHSQASEFNTADMIPLLFKGKIFPFISRPLSITAQSARVTAAGAQKGKLAKSRGSLSLFSKGRSLPPAHTH